MSLKVEALVKRYSSGSTDSDSMGSGVFGVSFEVAAGEGFSILGPSGCGKTTTLRMLGGFEVPDSGRILHHGQDITHLDPQDRDIRTVFQRYALFPHLNVRENIAFGLRMKGTPEAQIKKNVSEMAEVVQVQRMLDRKVSALSGGEQQRVALARALITEPEVLLLDEPLSALDLKLREKMQRELIQIRKRFETSFIIVTHDQEEAMMIADRIAVMNHGSIQQIGKPQEIYSRPANRFVAEFIGQANFVALKDVSLLEGQRDQLRGAVGSGEWMIRPEYVDVSHDLPKGRVGVKATVENVLFLGDSWMIFARDAKGVEWTVKRERTFSIPIEKGQSLYLHWQPEATWFVASP